MLRQPAVRRSARACAKWYQMLPKKFASRENIEQALVAQLECVWLRRARDVFQPKSKWPVWFRFVENYRANPSSIHVPIVVPESCGIGSEWIQKIGASAGVAASEKGTSIPSRHGASRWRQALDVDDALDRVHDFGSLIFLRLEHQQWRAQPAKNRLEPDTMSAEFPRGLVNYDQQTSQFTLVVDLCKRRRKTEVTRRGLRPFWRRRV